VRAEFNRLTDAPGAELYASLSPDGKTFLYASRASGNWDIYSRRVAGTAALNLTANSTDDDTQPAFSPDGELIAFRSSRQGGGIYIMGAMGDAPRRITTFGYHPAWSPNGKELVFASSSTEAPEIAYPSELWIADIATGATRKLRDSGYHPSWSPDGRWIAFWDGRISGRRDLFLISPDRGKPVQITNDLYLNWNPAWSPAGDYLYFASNRGGSMNLWRIRIDSAAGRTAGPPEPLITPSPYVGYISLSADGSHIAYISQVRTYNLYRIPFDPSKGTATGPPRPVTQGLMQAAYPDVSPDGTWLAFTSWEKNEDIVVMRIDGTAIRRITNDVFKDRGARWSRDGSNITFQSNRGGTSEIWSVNADGGGMRQLTKAGGVACPVLAPDGSRLVYTKGSVGAFLMDLTPAGEQKTPKFLPFPGEPGEYFRGTSWSPDGHRLTGYVHRPDNSPAGIAVYSFDTSSFEKLVNFGQAPLWLNDGRRLLFQNDGVIYSLDSRSKTVQQIASVQPNTIYDRLAVSPDNRWIYLSLVSNEADVWAMTLR
jgi:Tol biopolymer transport system component